MVSQPPRPPDMNVLDVGSFHSLQSLQYKTPTFPTDGQIAAVKAAFAKISVYTLDKCFLTLQKLVGKIIACKGGKNYSLPRVRKHHIHNGVLRMPLPVDVAVVDAGFRQLSQPQWTT
ncbi:hypothetical protein, variant 3 [Phytophthora nicotianae CJ01A1]|uniref:Uncharacterized protein n=1 Tax=Phytophthora nicotianae CJ01A1 TaxID=1317063 RepID=W2XUM2_PHYNI|nr:hypothetical protein F441_00892 [Phytophthora nicotianae CJ01A1]ETP26387.1 hypothetical protein, variant 1 [Phytophthora nicotianae CJ01A1]ETP26388.1 hypothetical protein, variant 2 [Phytophthora nicotianae CJ01A1]ETP26389.1 hypothetical protein, variant 3 [Phytophthora nicotianae CJ01A1]